jgi:3-methyladenine DNA glycosylase/8-oxoguanine DNA glycosylase
MAKKEKFVAPSLWNFLDVLDLLEKTPKTNDKKAILEENRDTSHLKEYLILAIDERVKFNINKIEANKGTGTAFSRMGLSSWDNFDRVVKALVNQDISGHAANDAVESFLRTCTDQEKKWYKRCIQKDIASTNVGKAIMDEVWPSK